MNGESPHIVHSPAADRRRLYRERRLVDFGAPQKEEIRNLIGAKQLATEFTAAAEQGNVELSNALLAGLQPGAKLSSIFQSMGLNRATVIEKLYIIACGSPADGLQIPWTTAGMGS